MARPKNKKDLLQLGNDNFEKLLKQLNGLVKKDKRINFPKGTLNRNIKDVLAHLHEWHNMMLEWYKVGMSGKKPEMPKKGFSWKTVPDLNKIIWETYKDEEFDDILRMVKKSHKKVRSLIEKHSDEELFTKKMYKWTGSTSLGAYLISSTSSHYDWAFKLIKKCTKQ